MDRARRARAVLERVVLLALGAMAAWVLLAAARDDLWVREELLGVPAAGLLLVALLGRLLSPRAGLALLAAVLPVALWVAAAPIRHVYDLRVRALGLAPLTFHFMHPAGYYAHKPGSSMRHRTPEFDVTYHIGSDGWRVMPRVASPRGRVDIYGCSVTFGHGVADQQPYPYLLAAGPWRGSRVRNVAVMGWGVQSAAMHLAEALRSGAALPRQVILATIDSHIDRIAMLPRPPWARPEVLMTPAELERARASGEPNAHHVAAVIRWMHRELARRGVPFLVLAIHLERPDRPERFSEEIRLVHKHGVFVREILFEEKGLVYDPDMHPTPRGHRLLASFLAGLPELASLRAP